MEVGDVTKVASRKRVTEGVEQLRDKVAKEAAKILKLRVAQDATYWDLKEKVDQLEGNHERLQQNMVEVQMQHETISGQYQEELRLRPETLNKVSGTREICSALESYSLRLKDTLARCRGDHGVLLEVMTRVGGALKSVTDKTRAGETAVRDLEERVKLSSEQQNQLLQLFSLSKQQSDKEICELKVKLESALKTREELMNGIHEMNRKLDKSTFDIGKKEETIRNLQGDIKQLTQELSIQSSEAKNALDKHQKDLKAEVELNGSLKNTIQEPESLIKNLCEQKIGLENKITRLENEQTNAHFIIEDINKKVEEATKINEKNKLDLLALEEEKGGLIKELKANETLPITREEEIKELTRQINSLVNENRKICEELEKMVEESIIKTKNVDERSTAVENLRKKMEESEKSVISIRETSDDKIKHLTINIEDLNKELDSKAMTITQLMSELKTSTDIRSKMESTLQTVRKESELEKDKYTEKERLQSRKIEQLEETVRDREEELTKQLLEMRAEEEHLQDKIQGMQNRIDNMQKELTARLAIEGNRIQPEQEDDAVMLTPGPMVQPTLTPQNLSKQKAQAPLSPILQSKGGFLAPPKKAQQVQSMIFNLFSDSSMDDSSLDESEVNRQFEALSHGEHLSPVPISALKRRSRVPAQQESLKYRKPMNNEGALSLSQVKDNINKERMFFKNRRLDDKQKKTK